MSNNIAPTENAFHNHLDNLLQAATDIAIHPDTDNNTLVEIIETMLSKSPAKASKMGPLLKSLNPTIKAPYYALMENKHSTPETYNLVKSALKEKQDTSKQIQKKATDLQQSIQETENELAELERYYVVEINSGNTDEQLKIEEKTQDLSAKLPTLKMMLKGNETALSTHQAIIKPLENILHQEKTKYSNRLASPYYKEFYAAQDEFVKSFHKLSGIRLGQFGTISPKENEFYIDQLRTQINNHNNDIYNEYAHEFSEVLKTAFSSPTDLMEFNPS